MINKLELLKHSLQVRVPDFFKLPFEETARVETKHVSSCTFIGLRCNCARGYCRAVIASWRLRFFFHFSYNVLFLRMTFLDCMVLFRCECHISSGTCIYLYFILFERYIVEVKGLQFNHIDRLYPDFFLAFRAFWY